MNGDIYFGLRRNAILFILYFRISALITLNYKKILIYKEFYNQVS